MTDRRRAVIYCRISNDPEGQERGVQAQEEDCRALANRLGLDVVSVYVDNDISASTRSRKARPQYDEMMERARAREFSVILAYSNSRLTRRPREWEDLIQLWEQHRVRVETVASGKYNLATADGRATARTVAAWDAAEAERTGERVARRALQRARDGEWHGGHVPHGYRVDESEVEGTVVRQLVINEETAVHMRRAADRVLAGDSLYAIAKDLNAAGVPTSKGAIWRSQTIRRALLSPSIAGKRRVKIADEDGQVLGTELVEGKWDAILPEATWQEVCEVLENPARRFQPVDGSYAGKRALGGLVICEACQKRLVGQTYRRSKEDALRARLICSAHATGGCGKVSIDYAPLEGFVLDLVMHRLESAEFKQRLSEAKKDDGAEVDLESLNLELDVLDARWNRLGDALESGAMTPVEVKHRRDRIEDERRVINEKLESVRADRARQGVRSPADAVALWKSNDVIRQRQFLSWMIKRVEVGPWPINPETGRAFPTRLTRKSSERLAARRGEEVETEAEFAERVKRHERDMLRRRVDIKWRA